MMENLKTDSHIAALVLEQGNTVFSAENDFKLLAGDHPVNPLELDESDPNHVGSKDYPI